MRKEEEKETCVLLETGTDTYQCNTCQVSFHYVELDITPETPNYCPWCGRKAE